MRCSIQERKKNEQLKAEKDEEESKIQFFKTLEASKVLADNLPALVDFLQKYTGSTGVYVGKLQYPEKEIAIDADDRAHLDYEAP